MSGSYTFERNEMEMSVRDVLVVIGEIVKNEHARYYAHQVFVNNLWGSELLWHCKHVLIYLTGWRGEEARDGKSLLKAYIAKYDV